VNSAMRMTRLLQSNTTNAELTFAHSVSQKLCNSYGYVAPTLDEQQEAYDIASSVGKLRNHNTFGDLIAQGYVQDDLFDAYLDKFVPFILTLGIPFMVCTALFILCVINWSCMCCPSCSVLRCGICDRPSTKSKIGWYTILSILFSLGMLGASIAGISLFADVTGKVDGTMCQVTFMLEELYDGKEDSNWFGINPLRNLMLTLKDDLYGTQTLFNNVSRNFTILQYKLDNVSAHLDNIREGYQNSTVTRPNFLEESTYTPQFLSTLNDTMGLAYESVNYFNSNLTKARTEFDGAVSDFKSERDSVIDAVNSGTLQADGIANDILSSLNWMNDHGYTVHDVAKGLSVGVKVCLVVMIVFSAFTLISAIINFWTKYKHLNQFIHLAWFVMGIFMVVAWIIATILFPATVACVEVCQVVDGVINNATFANMTMNSLFGTEQSSLKEALVVCLHGSGDIIDNFAIKDKLSLIDPLNDAITDAAQTVDINVLPTTIDLTELTGVLNSVSDNTQPDDPKTIEDLIFLTQYDYLNLDTGDQCAQVGDKWVLNEAWCTNYTTSGVMLSSDPDDYLLGSDLCIPIGSWTEPATRNITNRYNSALYQGCPFVNNPNIPNTRYTRVSFVQTVVNRFTRNRQGIKTLVDNIMYDVDSVNGQANDLIATTKDAMTAPFNFVKEFVLTIGNLVFDKEVGLVYNSQCTFVQTRMNELNNELCVNLIPTIYNTSISLIAGAAIGSALTLALFLMARKLASKQVEYSRAKTYPQ